MYDKSYSGETYAYGTDLNDILISMFDKLPVGKILCIAEGEERNVVWLTKQDVNMTTILADFDIKNEVLGCYCFFLLHLPSELLHTGIAAV